MEPNLEDQESTVKVESRQLSVGAGGWICPKCGLNVVASAAFCPQDGTPFGHDESAPGTMLSGRYEFLSTIGVGGMSIIYKARQPLLDKCFAIKMLHAHLINDQTIQRFQQEAKAISALKHKNVIAVYDFGVSEHGQPFMVMDFVDGVTLADKIRENGSLPLPEAMDVFVQVCEALAHAHERGILHRDLKPSNVMLIKDGTGFDVRLVDFGIAKIVYSEDSVAHQLTQTGELFGSPLYMSPEQCMGKSVDARSDIYSLGCILYESLVGRPPHAGETMIETIFKHLNEDPVNLHDARPDIVFPSAVNDFVMKLLATKPEDRYQDLSQVRAKLLEIQSGVLRGTTYHGLRFSLPFKLSTSRLALLSGVLLAAAGVISLLIAGSQWRDSDARRKSESTRASSSEAEMLRDLQDSSRLALESVDHEKITDARFAVWSHYLPELSQLHLDGAAIYSPSIARLRNLPKLEELNLSNLSLTDADMSMVSQLPALKKLYLNNNDISAFGLAMLGSLKTLRELHLQNTKVDNADLEAFAKLPALQTIDLRDTNIGDTGVKHLRNCRSLREMFLSGSDITDAGIASIKDLPLTNLQLGETKITSAGLAELKSMTSLMGLVLTRTQIRDEDLANLASLQKLNYLELNHTEITNAGIKHLAGLKGLTHVQLADTGIDDGAALILKAMPQLTTLDLSEDKLTDKTLEALAELPHLQAVTMLQAHIGSNGVKALVKCKELDNLRLNGTRISDSGLLALAGVKSLRTLELWDCPKISRAAVKEFREKTEQCDLKIYVN